MASAAPLEPEVLGGTLQPAYWLIGREIVEVEQHGKRRAGHGEELMNRLAERLTARYGKGFGPRTLRRVRRFYLTFPKGSALLAHASAADKWTAPVSKSSAPAIRSTPLIESGHGPTFPA